MTTEYYYEQLDREGKSAYHAIYEGLTDISPSFAVPRLSDQELSDIYFKIRMDHPEIFYTVKYKYRFYRNSEHIELLPEYIYSGAAIREQKNALESRLRKLTRPAQALSEAEKERYIHDFICRNIHYDKLKKPYSHEIIGSLGQGVAVCEGIAKAVKILCDRLGLWCIVVLAENNPDKGIKYRHAWNLIRIGGKLYHLDATFDLSLTQGEPVRYDYFNLSDKQIFRDHEPAVYPVPVAGDSDGFYYREKKLSFTRQEDVEKRIDQAARKKRILVFHWRGGYLTREMVERFVKVTEEAARGTQCYAAVSVNWPQAVMKIEFKKEKPEFELRTEQANEGEEE